MAHITKRTTAEGQNRYLFTGPKGGPIAPVHWYKSFRLARDAIGLPELHPHDLRHAAGTLFAQQGATTRELGVGRSTIYQLIGDGDLEVVHIGRSARVPVESVQGFVRRLRAG